MKKNIKAIIFDFDGVVVNSEPLYEETGRQLFRQFGIEVQDEDWKEFKGLSAEKFFIQAKEKYKINATLDELYKIDHEILKNKFREKLEYIEGFHDFIEFVKDNYLYALVTSTSMELLNWIFSNTQINKDFDTILTSDDVKNPKPDPEPFIKIGKRLKICPSEMVVIEDSINGVISAKKAGSYVIGFLTSFKKEDLPDADIHVESFKELRDLLIRNANGF